MGDAEDCSVRVLPLSGEGSAEASHGLSEEVQRSAGYLWVYVHVCICYLGFNFTKNLNHRNK